MMKFIIFLGFFLLSSIFISTNSFAENIKLKFSMKKFEFIEEDGLKVDQIQAKLRCHFIHNSRGNNIIRSRYPFTHISNDDNKTWVSIKKSSLTEYMPNFNILNCSYLLIVFGKTKEGRSLIGDIVLVGKNKGVMSQEDLDFIQNTKLVNYYLDQEFLKFGLGIHTINGKMRIIITNN